MVKGKRREEILQSLKREVKKISRETTLSSLTKQKGNVITKETAIIHSDIKSLNYNHTNIPNHHSYPRDIEMQVIFITQSYKENKIKNGIKCIW